MRSIDEHWTRATNEHLSALLDYLLPQEWRAVPFTSRLLRQGKPTLSPRLDSAVMVLTAADSSLVHGAILRTTGGLLLPVMPFSADPVRQRQDRLRRTPAPELSLPRHAAAAVYSIMGPAAEVRWLEECVGEELAASVDYALMTLGEHAFHSHRGHAEASPPGLRLRQAESADLGRLFPLQKAYELEEVVVFPERFSDQACRLNLRRTLRQQLVVMAEIDGRAVSKAGTNARGFQVDQIGGVFTVDDRRGGGIAARVMSELLERIFRTKPMVALFVKSSNLPAMALYRRLGFQTLDSYRICYFQR